MRAGARKVAVVNQALVDPVLRRRRIPSGGTIRFNRAEPTCRKRARSRRPVFEIVGVVADAREPGAAGSAHGGGVPALHRYGRVRAGGHAAHRRGIPFAKPGQRPAERGVDGGPQRGHHEHRAAWPTAPGPVLLRAPRASP